MHCRPRPGSALPRQHLLASGVTGCPALRGGVALSRRAFCVRETPSAKAAGISPSPRMTRRRQPTQIRVGVCAHLLAGLAPSRRALEPERDSQWGIRQPIGSWPRLQNSFIAADLEGPLGACLRRWKLAPAKPGSGCQAPRHARSTRQRRISAISSCGREWSASSSSYPH